MIAYDVERFVAQALDSALMQEVDFDYEIVIGEDCSTDGTREILKEYASRHPDRIRLILRERNLGMNPNFKETLLACRGELIALLDADDYWTSPRKLQRQVDFLEAHPECSICFHNTLVVYEDQDVAPHPFHLPEPVHHISHYLPKPISTIADLAGGNFMQTCSVIFRAGLYGELPEWYLDMPTFDWPLHLLNAEHGDIGYLDEIMGVYRVHRAGFWSMRMSRYDRFEDVEGMIEAYRIVDRRTGHRYQEKIRSQLLPLYERAAAVLLRDGRSREARAYAREGLRPLSRRHLDRHRRAVGLILRSFLQQYGLR
jgi:glycosyltransferase involved in cell wall biosynthesis